MTNQQRKFPVFAVFAFVALMGAVAYQQARWFDGPLAIGEKIGNASSKSAQSFRIVSPIVEQSRYSVLAENSPFSLDLVDNSESTDVQALGRVRTPKGQVFLVKFDEKSPATLMAIGEKYKGWELLAFEGDFVKFAGPFGIKTVPVGSALNTRSPRRNLDNEDSDQAIFQEVEDIINDADEDQ